MIRVLLADDHSVVRDGLRRLVDGAGDMTVVAEAADGREAIRKARETSPDVAVVDISMPGLDGLEVVRRLIAERPKLPVLVLTMHEEEQYVVRAIGAGAKGYITKRSAAEQLLQAIRKVHAGGRYLSESASEALAERMAKGGEAGSLLDILSDREIQVLRGLAMGRSNREIAEAYDISIKTVDTYRFRLLNKLNLRNNVELTRFAIRKGIVEL
ncbi:MAG: response regulator transcription factor [Deltaproteobacteria bacterium]|nr:response regulator transcription factor [Deltaproteobacteria bacterium]